MAKILEKARIESRRARVESAEAGGQATTTVAVVVGLQANG
jgi:hypothetical protein